MCHSPGVVSMTIDGFFMRMGVVFEWVSSACAFTGEHLLIHRFVTFGQRVKGPLAHRGQVPLLRLLQVLSVRATFGFACHCIVVRCEHFFNKVENFSLHLSCTTTVGKVRNQANVAASIPSLGVSV